MVLMVVNLNDLFGLYEYPSFTSTLSHFNTFLDNTSRKVMYTLAIFAQAPVATSA